MIFRRKRNEAPPAPCWDPSIHWTPSRPPTGAIAFGAAGVVDEHELEVARRQGEIEEQARRRRRDFEAQQAAEDAADRRPGGDDGAFSNLLR